VIVRPHPDHLLLITQPDHAALAAGIMDAWQQLLPDAAVRDVVLLATREHDNGWHEPDAAPLVDETSGRILDFMSAPESVRQSIWPRAVERLSSTPYAAALVAQHALNVYDHYRKLPAWRPFFERMESARHDALRRAAPHTIEDLARDYFFVRMGDLASLTFCNGWNEPQRLDGFELRLEGPRLTIRPDPFDGREVPLSISARELPARHYRSDADAYEAFRSAPTVIVDGVALGAS
jgi:Protein of unknown function (DUF3891)